MAKQGKLKKISLSIFFPCYNDAGTIASMVELATLTAKKISSDFEIIVIDDGSVDRSREILNELKLKNKYLRLVFHEKNKGYGGALISGFGHAKKDFVFYTDGDFQYDVAELEKLAGKLSDSVDIVQGYKVKRNDPWYRILVGNLYNFVVILFFKINIRDVDCDFRLIRRSAFSLVNLTHNSGVITVEMVFKFQRAGLKFVEIPVSHFHRSYGSSQFFNIKRIFRVFVELFDLWKEVMILKPKP